MGVLHGQTPPQATARTIAQWAPSSLITITTHGYGGLAVSLSAVWPSVWPAMNWPRPGSQVQRQHLTFGPTRRRPINACLSYTPPQGEHDVVHRRRSRWL